MTVSEGTRTLVNPEAVTVLATETSRVRGPWAGKVTHYAIAIVLVAIAHVIVASTEKFIGPAITCVFLSAVLIASLYGGRGPGVLATFLSVLDLDFTFTAPRYSLSIVFDDFLWIVVFVAVALLTSSLQAGRRRAEESLRIAHGELQKLVAERSAALAESQEQFRLLVNGMVDQAVFALDGAGKIVSWNAGAERLLGYDAGEMAGRNLSAIWPPSEGRSLDGSALEELAGLRYEDQAWVSRQGGGRFWASMLLTPLQDASGRPRGYAVAVRDVTERRTLEQEIVEISEREQQRIGHDLHDGLGQELTGIAMMATALAEQLGTTGVPGGDDAEKVADLIHNAIGHTRSLARGLCPVDLEDEGLASALQRLATRISGLPGMHCGFETHGLIHVDSLASSHLYHIAQEAINNAIRHGRAHHIGVELSGADERLKLTVTDDGSGFAKTDDLGAADGMGLRLMRYRAKTIRGAIRIGASASGGTRVECSIGRSDAE